MSAFHLADRINQYHAAAVKHSRHALENARAAGELLLEAKEECTHGEWLNWLEIHFVGSTRTAQRYTRVVKRWQRIVEANKNDTVSHLRLCEALELARYGYTRKPQLRKAVESRI